MPILWDPISVLNLPAHHTCVGKASHQDHCGARINKDSAAQVENYVRVMAQLPADSDAVYELLISLALCGLCKKYHRRQLPVMIDEWEGKIGKYLAAKITGQGSVGGDESVTSYSSSSNGEHSAFREAHVAGPIDPDTVEAHGLGGDLLAENAGVHSTATSKYMLVLPVILMVIFMGIAIAVCFNPSSAFPLAFNA